MADAAIQLTKVENNEMRVFHLCEACAAEQGVEPTATTTNLPLANFLAQIGSGMSEEASASGRCPSCGLTSSQLKQSGRVGCADCYIHYEKHLRALLRRLHAGTQHVGKMMVTPDAVGADREAQVDSLRRGLQRAVDSEDFERAASIRDQLRRLETAE